MEYRLIKAKEQFLIVSDEEIKIGDFVWDGRYNPQEPDYPFYNVEETDDIPAKNFTDKKIIAQQNQIDFSSLSEEEQKKIGWFDKVSLSMESTKHQTFANGQHEEIVAQIYYRKSFQKAQELLSDRMFTIEDMIDFARMCRENDSHKVLKDEELLQTTDLFEQWNKMDQPKSWEIEIEMDFVHTDHVEGGFEYFPKLTNGKIKILKLL
jgi:hypothetical protein